MIAGEGSAVLMLRTDFHAGISAGIQGSIQVHCSALFEEGASTLAGISNAVEQSGAALQLV